jgi:hypothetical protein
MEMAKLSAIKLPQPTENELRLDLVRSVKAALTGSRLYTRLGYGRGGYTFVPSHPSLPSIEVKEFGRGGDGNVVVSGNILLALAAVALEAHCQNSPHHWGPMLNELIEG